MHVLPYKILTNLLNVDILFTFFFHMSPLRLSVHFTPSLRCDEQRVFNTVKIRLPSTIKNKRNLFNKFTYKIQVALCKNKKGSHVP